MAYQNAPRHAPSARFPADISQSMQQAFFPGKTIRPWTTHELTWVRKYCETHSIQSMARHLGRSPSAVRSFVRRNGLEMPPQGKTVSRASLSDRATSPIIGPTRQPASVASAQVSCVVTPATPRCIHVRSLWRSNPARVCRTQGMGCQPMV